ncbi:CYTH and CHAD domain-containing protein [Corynebacterium sp. HMSC074A01]|uniref:CYTH and CHAD domain-containing protein n=1 Tax=Corynebacterium sp. HMSC074A01 TaxID=1715030 RepID=UPI0009F5C8D4|nr:CYTH and CHAD domain-containing protein [Corynebacterium sp. HMSC074A01]
MPQEVLEVEVKFAVEEGVKPPGPPLVDATLSITSTTTHNLSATYFDTEDLRLTHAKTVLRRRTGGTDDGWHVKFPGEGGARRELQVPLADASDAEVPAELLDAVSSVIGDAPLVKIAQVDNRRVESVLSKDGIAYAEFCDDHVTSESFLPGGQKQSWREWELELTEAVAGTEAGETLLNNASEAMLAAGARPADAPSKLVKALGDSLPAGPVDAALRETRDRIVDYAPRVRADEEDAVHQMRVSTRTMRSLLETFEGAYSGTDVAHLEAELKHAAAVLGVARDAEVVEQRIRDLVATDETGTIDAATAANLNRDMREVYAAAHAEIVQMLDSERFGGLLVDVDKLQRAGEQTDAELYAQLRGAYKKLKKRHAKMEKYADDASLPLAEREAYVHAVRKAAKKLRYAAVAASDSGLKTKPLVKACVNLQSVLGDFQDSVTTREHLVRLAHAAHARGEDTFAYGVLYQRELELGRAALAGYPKAMKKVKKALKKL